MIGGEGRAGLGPQRAARTVRESLPLRTLLEAKLLADRADLRSPRGILALSCWGAPTFSFTALKAFWSVSWGPLGCGLNVPVEGSLLANRPSTAGQLASPSKRREELGFKEGKLRVPEGRLDERSLNKGHRREGSSEQGRPGQSWERCARTRLPAPGTRSLQAKRPRPSLCLSGWDSSITSNGSLGNSVSRPIFPNKKSCSQARKTAVS